VSERETVLNGEESFMESLSTRWYTPLVAVAVALLALMIVALAVVEVLVASAPPAATPGGWAMPLERAEASLRDGDVAQALAWWREARVEALRSGQWEGLIEVGDASRRLGARGGFRPDGDANARDAYRAALLRARRQHSVDGVLRAAVAFGELGDREVVADAMRTAEHQAGQDLHARARVRAVADRLLMPPLESGHPTIPGGVQP
jgi:hypothetical protein